MFGRAMISWTASVMRSLNSSLNVTRVSNQSKADTSVKRLALSKIVCACCSLLNTPMSVILLNQRLTLTSLSCDAIAVISVNWFLCAVSVWRGAMSWIPSSDVRLLYDILSSWIFGKHERSISNHVRSLAARSRTNKRF